MTTKRENAMRVGRSPIFWQVFSCIAAIGCTSALYPTTPTEKVSLAFGSDDPATGTQHYSIFKNLFVADVGKDEEVDNDCDAMTKTIDVWKEIGVDVDLDCLKDLRTLCNVGQNGIHVALTGSCLALALMVFLAIGSGVGAARRWLGGFAFVCSLAASVWGMIEIHYVARYVNGDVGDLAPVEGACNYSPVHLEFGVGFALVVSIMVLNGVASGVALYAAFRDDASAVNDIFQLDRIGSGDNAQSRYTSLLM